MKVIGLYEMGVVTWSETLCQIVETATKEELLELPEKWRKNVKDYIGKMPVTDEGWEHIICFSSVTNSSGYKPPSQEELRARWKERVEFVRGIL